MEVKFKRYSKQATAPQYATNGSAGYDLFSSMNKLIAANSHELIRTDLMLEIPPVFVIKYSLDGV